jgi:hypothetical protein
LWLSLATYEHLALGEHVLKGNMIQKVKVVRKPHSKEPIQVVRVVRKPDASTEKTIGTAHDNRLEAKLEVPRNESKAVTRRKIQYAESSFAITLGGMILEAAKEYRLTPAQVMDIAIQGYTAYEASKGV